MDHSELDKYFQQLGFEKEDLGLFIVPIVFIRKDD